MKKISTLAIAMSALLFVNMSAKAQNSNSRNMEKRNQADQNTQYSQRTDQYNRGNKNDQYNQRNDQYSRGNENDQCHQRNDQYIRDNQYGQYGKHDGRFNNRRPEIMVVFGNHGRRNNDRYDFHHRRYEYNRGFDNGSHERRGY